MEVWRLKSRGVGIEGLVRRVGIEELESGGFGRVGVGEVGIGGVEVGRNGVEGVGSRGVG